MLTLLFLKMTKQIYNTLTDLLDSYKRHLKEPLRPVERDKTKDIIDALVYALRVINKSKEDNQPKLF